MPWRWSSWVVFIPERTLLIPIFSRSLLLLCAMVCPMSAFIRTALRPVHVFDLTLAKIAILGWPTECIRSGSQRERLSGAHWQALRA